MIKIYRYSHNRFDSNEQTAWIKFLKDLKKVDSFKKEPSLFYWIGVQLIYKILFKNTMLAKALQGHFCSKQSKGNIYSYDELKTGKSILSNLDPQINERSKGVWVFIGTPTKRDLNKNCFSDHCEMNLYKGDVSEDTMAYEVFGNLLTYKTLKEHKLNYATAVFIPNPKVLNIELVDKNKEKLNFCFYKDYGFLYSMELK